MEDECCEIQCCALECCAFAECCPCCVECCICVYLAWCCPACCPESSSHSEHASTKMIAAPAAPIPQMMANRGIEMSNGGVYDGELDQANRPDGYGKMTYSQGGVYVGEFKAGKREGIGKHTCSEGSVYIGQWVADATEGHGKWVWSNGDVYEGEFKGGKREGHGKMAYSDRNVYEGKFKGGERHGLGKMIMLRKGLVLEGEFKEGEPAYTGRWIVTTVSGTVCETTFSQHGSGVHAQDRVTYANGDVYENEAKRFNLEAAVEAVRGKITYSNGDVYVGELLVQAEGWINTEVVAPRIDSACQGTSTLQGFGMFTNKAAGTQIEGRFAANKLINEGVLRNADGLFWRLHDGSKVEQISSEEAEQVVARCKNPGNPF